MTLCDSLLTTLDRVSTILTVDCVVKMSGCSNTFKDLKLMYGFGCFKDQRKLKKIRNNIYAQIRSQCNYKKVVKNIIRAALAFHNEQTDLARKAGLDSPEATSGTIGAVLIAAHLCQKYQVNDATDLVRNVVVLIFQHEGGFDRFFSFLDPLVFPYEVDPIIFPAAENAPVSGDYSASGNIAVLEYFLRTIGHLLKVKYKFSELNFTENVPIKSYSRSILMVDAPVPSCRGSTPLLMACHSVNPEAVLLLLRYGANPLQRGQAHQIIGFQFQQPLYIIVSKLNVSLCWCKRQTTMSDDLKERFHVTHARQAAELQLCLRYFCRALPKPPITFCRAVSEDGQGPSKLFRLSPDYQEAFPKDMIAGEPPYLQHLCRCMIRSQLALAGTLPRAVYDLEIPKMLQAYLDLLID